jgi:hypothetical protein
VLIININIIKSIIMRMKNKVVVWTKLNLCLLTVRYWRRHWKETPLTSCSNDETECYPLKRNQGDVTVRSMLAYIWEGGEGD